MTGRHVIVGGGPCGLSAAWQLAREGHAPLVLERENTAGGLCATHERDGFRFDLGGHRFVSADHALSRWLTALLGDDLLTQRRKSAVLYRGRRFDYPLELGNLAKNLDPVECARALAGYAAARARKGPPAREVTFEDWVVRRFGRPLYDSFFGPYTQKLWGIAPTQISCDWAAERISPLSLGDALLRMLGFARPPARSYAKRYLYPRLGMGQLYDAMARDVVAHGGQVVLGARVDGMDVSAGRVTHVRFESRGVRERVRVRRLLSTMPLPSLVAQLATERPAAVERARQALRFRSLSFVNLMLERSEFSPDTWMYVSSPQLTISRIQEPKRRSPAMAPAGKTSLMLEVPCEAGDRTWRAGVEELRARGIDELGRLGFAVDDVRGAFVTRVEHGYPIYHLGYDCDRRLLLDYITKFENVITAGRQGLFRYIFMDAAMNMGLRAAAQMVSGPVDVRALDAIGRSTTLVEGSALTAS